MGASRRHTPRQIRACAINAHGSSQSALMKVSFLLSCPVLFPSLLLSLRIADVSLGQVLTVCASFPLPALPGFIGTMTASDSRATVWLPLFVALFAILPLRGERAGLPSCCIHIVHHAWLFDPGAASARSPYRSQECCLPVRPIRRPARTSFRGSITFRPNALLSTLKHTHCCVRSMTRYQRFGYSFLDGVSSR